MTIVAGTLMRYKSLDIQKQQILCKDYARKRLSECQPNVFADTGCFFFDYFIRTV